MLRVLCGLHPWSLPTITRRPIHFVNCSLDAASDYSIGCIGYSTKELAENSTGIVHATTYRLFERANYCNLRFGCTLLVIEPYLSTWPKSLTTVSKRRCFFIDHCTLCMNRLISHAVIHVLSGAHTYYKDRVCENKLKSWVKNSILFWLDMTSWKTSGSTGCCRLCIGIVIEVEWFALRSHWANVRTV